MAQLDKLAAQRLTKDLKTKFNLQIDRLVNFVNYGKEAVSFKLAGDEYEKEVWVRQGNPFTSLITVPATKIVEYIQQNYPQYEVSLSYGHIISGHLIPHAKIKCTQL